ncbi:MAG: hypothetical protein GF330_08115 [Candidatus Eisenbacteria bacterium]|nr:hypothetical protein [Candidatus Eisenbacteria bacterium]
MGNYAYVAKTPAGQEISGYLSADGPTDVADHLQEQGYVVLRVAPDEARPGFFAHGLRIPGIPGDRVAVRDLAVFTRQLGALLDAGIPLTRGLHGLAQDTRQRTLADAAENVAMRIERGEGLSDALEAQPRVFNSIYVSMVRAAEQAGVLAEILDELAAYLEDLDALRTKVRSALSYPLFVIAFAAAATAFLFFKIVPTFADIYAEMGQQLPGLTRLVLSISAALGDHAAVGGGLTLLAVVSAAFLVRTPAGGYARDALVLRLPLFGAVIRKAVLSRFARTLGVLLRSGVPILEALRLTRAAVGNQEIARAIGRARDRIGIGQGVTSSFRTTGKMPQMVLQLMGTGEESGELDGMLIKASQFYDRQVAAAVEGLTALIEPLMIVLVGGAIGVIVVSMFLPILYLGDAVMKGGMSF